MGLGDAIAVARRFLLAEQHRLDSRRSELDDLATTLAPIIDATQAARIASGIQVTSSAEALSHISTALATPQATLLVSIGDDAVDAVASIHRDGQWLLPPCSIRSLWPIRAVDDPGLRLVTQDRRQHGDGQRVADDPPGSFAVVNNEFVYAVSEPATPYLDGVLLDDALVVRSYVRLFERAWRDSSGFPAPGGADEHDVRILELLSRGAKDEVIARHLGISVRTVRRRIAALMAHEGATTRFELGVAAVRRGSLPAGLGAGRSRG